MEEEMEELYVEGVATRDDPEPCVGVREGTGETSGWARAGRAIEPRNHRVRGADAVYGSGRPPPCRFIPALLRDHPTSHTHSSQDYRLGVPWASRPLIAHTGGRGISRFSRMKVPYMPWFFDHAGSDGASR